MTGQESTLDEPFEEPRSRRVGITGPPSSFRLSSSTSDTTSDSAAYSTPPSSPNPSTPPRPPRSPLRAAAPVRRASASLLNSNVSDVALDTDEMPLSHSRSFGSFSGILSNGAGPQQPIRSSRPVTPDKPLPITPKPSTSTAAGSDEHVEEAVGVTEPATPMVLRTPAVSKRTHALQELLSSERAYASDLAIMRDIHIPLALGQPSTVQGAPATPPPSEPSSRTHSTMSDVSSICSTVSTAPSMTREDTRIIFNNVEDLAQFSDTFTEQIEEALGSVLEGGSGEDHIGALFLRVIPTLEPLYLAYITKHPSALEHLNNLPQTPALTLYLAQSRTLASSLTHAWDLPSLLIKPVQRLLKYPLLLSAIIEETPDAHPDKAKLKLARAKMEEVARSVNEGRRRREVVKEVLNAAAGVSVAGPSSNGTPSKRHSDPKPKPKKKGLNLGISASVSLGRMKSFSASSSSKANRAKEGVEASEEAERVRQLGEEVKRYEAFARTFAKEAVDVVRALKEMMAQLSTWSDSFGRVIGIRAEGDSEAFTEYWKTVTVQVPALCNAFEEAVKDRFLVEMTKIVDSTLAPLRLLEAMQTLEPLHLGLLNLNVSKSRPPPQLLEASQSYVALRAQLAAELPSYIELLHRSIWICTTQFQKWHGLFYGHLRATWWRLWDSLKVDGEMNAGATETLRVWWSRFGDAETDVLGLNIVRHPEKRSPDMVRSKSKYSVKGLDDQWSETSSTVLVPSIYTVVDEFPSSPSTLSVQTPTSTKARSVRSMDLGLGPRQGSGRRTSNESLRSKKSGKSAKSMGHNPSQSIGNIEPEVGYHRAALNSLSPSSSQKTKLKPTYTRTKSMPIPAPLPLTKSYSQSRLLDEDPDITARAEVPPHAMIESHSLSYDGGDRGRSTRKPSIKRRLTDSLRNGSGSSGSQHRRSPSLPVGMSPSPSPNAASTSFPANSSVGPSSRRSSKRPAANRSTSSRIPSLYSCRVIHPCEPPPGVSYRDLPFFTLCVGDLYDVLQEAGHPSTHPDLPLYVDDGEDCLLLVRNGVDDIGWALASFLVPSD